jgi:hypothetical protein
MNAGGGGSSNPIAEVILRLVRGGDPSSDGPGGGPSGDVPEGADTRADRRDTRDTNKRTTGALADINKKTSGYVRNTLGINLGIASILKQSQIFTGILGTIFQILGALVDVILAPFLPIIVPALKLMAENIPQIREKAEQIVGVIVKVIQTIAHWIGKLLNLLPGSFGKVLKDMFQYWILGLFLARLFGFHKIYMALTKTIGAGIMFILNKIFGATVARGGGGGPIPGGGGGAGAWGSYGSHGAARGGGRLAAMRAMRPGIGAMGMGAMAVGGGIALGASQAGGIGAAYAIGGAVIGGGLGMFAGPMGAMIGASIGSIAGGALAAVIHGANDEQKANLSARDTMNAVFPKWSYQQSPAQFAETRRNS